MRSVAIVAFAETSRAAAKHSQASEVWTLNHGAIALAEYLPRLDRVFELHQPEHIASPMNSEAYVEWLLQPQPFPIYMLDAYPGVPSAKAYPFEYVRSLFSGLTHGDERSVYLTSTVALMMALAIMEGFELIELYGVEMSSNGEYVYQRDGVTLLAGIALGLGVQVRLPQESKLLRAAIYGLEKGQMINRQALEQRKSEITLERDKAVSELNRRNARYHEVVKQQPESAEEMAAECEDAKALMYANDGALQLLDQLIAECDLQDSRQALVNRIVSA